MGPVQRDQGVQLDQQHPGGRVEPQEGGHRRLHRNGGRHRGIPLVNQVRMMLQTYTSICERNRIYNFCYVLCY